MENEKIGFFKKVKLAIFNLEKYSIFAKEKFSKALKYVFILVILSTLILAVASTIQISKEAEKLINFVKSSDFPNFELKDGKISSDSFLDAYDEEYNSRLIIDTSDDLSTDKIEEYKKEGIDANYLVILLKDKIIYRFDSTLSDGYETTYNNVTSVIGSNDLNKEKLLNEYLNNDSLFKIKMVIGIYAFITILLLNVITVFEDILVIGLFGWIACKIVKIRMSISKIMSLAIYSLTLSIILSTIYSVVYSFTTFQIKYFELMYMIIAYIYIIAAIMIMKDNNKTASDVVTVEGQVIKTEQNELDSQEDNKEENEDESDKDEESNKKENLDNKNKRKE